VSITYLLPSPTFNFPVKLVFRKPHPHVIFCNLTSAIVIDASFPWDDQTPSSKFAFPGGNGQFFLTPSRLTCSTLYCRRGCQPKQPVGQHTCHHLAYALHLQLLQLYYTNSSISQEIELETYFNYFLVEKSFSVIPTQVHHTPPGYIDTNFDTLLLLLD
jgi:hypothetical protein